MEQLRTGERRLALFSECEKYRFSLKIEWGSDGGLMQFIGLNPSTADENQNDPTVRRCCDFAKAGGHDGIVMTNLFSLRATDPRVMLAAREPCLKEFNFPEIAIQAKNANKIVACWGCHGGHRGRDIEMIRWVVSQNRQLYAFKLTKEGYPQHPLYLPGSLKPRLMSELRVEKAIGDKTLTQLLNQ